MSARNAFGHPVIDPSRLTHPELVDLARALSGTLLASDDVGMRWFGGGLSAWLHTGGDLAVALGLRLAGGGHRTAQRILRGEHVDRLTARLVCALRSQSKAARVLAGAEPTPAAVADLVEQLHTLGAPCSRRSIVAAVHRARRRDCAA